VIRPTQRGNPDWILLGAVLGLSAIGVAMVYSASANYAVLRLHAGEGSILVKHLARLGIGGVAFLFAYLFPYQRMIGAGRFLLLALVPLLLGLAVLGRAVKGAARWVKLANVSIQPSELVKLALILSLAGYLVERAGRLRSFREDVVPALIRILIPAGLIAIQPNFSMASMVILLGIAMLFLGGLRPVHLALMAAPGVVGMAAIFTLAPYRMARLTAFLTDETGKSKAAYQGVQALIALGNGGVFGTGLGRGISKMLYLPEPYTDMVFAILGEELGLIGAVFVLGLFALVVWRGLRAALHAPDLEGRFLAAGSTMAIFLNVLIHVMVCTRTMPTTGQTLPFISYGGSSLALSFVLVGIILNVSCFARDGIVAMDVPAPRDLTGRRTAWR
jgi:cell division protein FtsW